jgi:hypothetical protein
MVDDSVVSSVSTSRHVPENSPFSDHPCFRNGLADTENRLEMAGCSITLLKADDELLGYWDAPVKTPGLRWGK